jgi:hypothetical protein
MTSESKPDGDGISPQGWMIAEPGSPVVTADGEEIGSVRERTPLYLQVRAHRDLLNDVEMYVPNELIQTVEGGRVLLGRTREQLEAMDLTTPPALKR